MQHRGHITYDLVEQKTRERLHRLAVPFSSSQTLESSLLEMMSAMGELSNLAHRLPASLSPFEEVETTQVIGRVAVALTVVSISLHVHVGEAALNILDEVPKPIAQCNRRAASAPQVETHTAAHASHPRASMERAQLSPKSTQRKFFAQLEQLSSMTRAMYENYPFKWEMPTASGSYEELITNGHHTLVNYDDIPHYVDMVKKHRDAQVFFNQAPATTTGSPGIEEAQMFSPSHNDRSLFIPVAVDPKSTKHLNGNTASSTSARPRPPTTTTQTYFSPVEFERNVNHLRNGNVKGSQIASLGLTFSIPDGDTVVDLIRNGMHVGVTAENVKEFLRLVDEYRSALHATTNKVHRTESVRRHNIVHPPAEDMNNYSPSHFSSPGLFAPCDTRRTFYLDCDEVDVTLPEYLQNLAAKQPRQSLYLAAVYRCDYTTLKRIIQEVRLDPSALKKYGVTFGVPSSLEDNSTPEEVNTGVHALFPNSAFQLVEPGQQKIFLTLIRQYNGISG